MFNSRIQSAPTVRLIDYVLVQHDRVIDRARCVESLAYSEVDLFVVWAVYANYGEYQRRIAHAVPCFVSDGDATFTIDTDLRDNFRYVDGSVFVPSAIRSRLANLADHGEFDQLRLFLPHVASKPVLTKNGSASPYKTIP